MSIAIPRRGVSPQQIGAVVAAVGAGLLIVLLSVKALGTEGAGLPNPFFYIFALIALGACLRVITHPRPVYAALYFILSILATAGLYLLLSAEFMAFALIIVYAGAILITYLFVIMLATQSPTEHELDDLPEYDAIGREPAVATLAAFVLLAALTTMIFRGVPALPAPVEPTSDAIVAQLPQRVAMALQEADLLQPGETLARGPDERYLIDPEARTAAVTGEDGLRLVAWPEDLQLRNVEGVGFSLLNDYPGAIEIAGVILLMAMLGAVVLARKQAQEDEEAKARAATRLAQGGAR
ncbi:MAG: NADH-quinone oxidoreductase subunit J [Phycisphaerales bacterium JB039]